MNKNILLLTLLLSFTVFANTQTILKISRDQLKNKIAGGWAGKMIGVTYGAPVEFKAQGRIYDEPINWVPKDIKGSLWQDDLYVQLTFMMTMDKYGIDAPAARFQEMFAKAGYMLWHANVQARKNYYDNILPPASGNPKYNPHADDIDFQIEADYLGLMCPGLPNTAAKMASKIGHIMNYGDGVYGGIFLSSLYTYAFFDNNISSVIDKALRSLPAQSDYAKIIKDVIKLHAQYPADWKDAWKELQAKWGNDHFCGAGETFNIDAKFNGAFIVMGLLYGEGEPYKTLEVTARCGQDADCNPSSAMAILGVLMGYDHLPVEMKNGVKEIADSLFINTDYSYNKAIEHTYQYAIKLITENGGKINNDQVYISSQIPKPVALEISFPNVVLNKRVSIFQDNSWRTKGSWQSFQNGMRDNKPYNQSKYSDKAGDEISIDFIGTGIAINGNWVKDGGKAEVYLDGNFSRTIDTYYYYNEQEHENMTLWHITGLQEGKHSVRLVVLGKKRPESFGTKLYLTEAILFKTAPKKSSLYSFTFEKK